MAPSIVDFAARSSVIDGLFMITMKQVTDERGTVREFYRESAFAAAGLPSLGPWLQVNVTETAQGAVRGLHGEQMHKLVAVVAGEAFGAYVDARPHSATYGTVVTAALVPGQQVLVPRGVANGFQAVASGVTQYVYCFDQEWVPGMAGVACNPLDPALAIDWPLPIDPGDLRAAVREGPQLATTRTAAGIDMRQLVTGGAGFIGSNYVRHVLAHTDDEVVVYDALTYAGNLSTLRDVDDDPRYSFVHGNICDPSTLTDAMQGADAVVHFAAESHVDRSIVGSDDFVTTNCFGTNVVMDTARRLEIPRVVHIGTDEVYGSVETGSSREGDPLEPRSPYSASKAGSDLIALSYHHTHGVPVTVTRCTNNFGPYQYPEKAIPLFTTNLLDGGQIPLYGDGLNERDWLYVDDHCAAVRLVLEKGEVGEIYNVGAGNETPNRVLVDKLLALLGKDETSVDYVEDRLGHDRRYSVDITKITALGWSRTRSLDEALEATVAWYRANDWWWRPLRGAR